MKRFGYLLFLSFLAACSSSKVISFYVVEEQSINFESFSFYTRNLKDLRPQQKELDSLIELSISTELIRKGFKKRDFADVYVSYKISLGTSSTASVERPRYSSPVYYPNNNVNTTHYKEGVLLIEISTKDDKLLWQGSKSFKVGKSTNTRLLLLDYAQEITGNFKPNL